MDDEPNNITILEIILGAEGYELMSADSGASAYALAAERRPDLILSDLMMPGMNGNELLMRLKANAATKEIPVVIVTSLDDASTRSHCLSSGAADVLPKPATRELIVRRVRELLAPATP